MSKAAELAALIGSQAAQSNRNIIINGAMQISQRSTSDTSVHTTGFFSCDRFQMVYSNEDELRQTITQASDGPDGFANSLKIQTTTAESAVASDERSYVIYRAEGQDLQQLAYGTSAAKKITLSFYVKSSVTGTYAVSAYKEDGNDIVGSTYTINSANTWERKSITFPVDTSTAIADDNTSGMAFYWALMIGSDYTSVDNSAWGEYATNNFFYGHAQNGVATTINAIWQLTGVQLELGEQATPFEHRSFADELHRCQRYYAVRENATGGTIYYGNTLQAYGTSSIYGVIADYPVTMRATPTVSQSGTFGAYKANSGDNSMNSTIGNLSATSHAWRTGGWSGTSNLTAGHASVLFANNGAKLMADAEL